MSNTEKSKDDTLDHDMEHLFEDDRFDPATLNPVSHGNVDEGRKYYRSASADHGSTQTFEDEARFATDSAPLDHGHDNHEFPHSKSIMSKHKKKSVDGSSKRSKHDRERPHLPSIRAEDEAEVGGGSSETSLPWKTGLVKPVLDSEHASTATFKDSSATPPVFSSSEKEEPEKKGGGVKFTLGEQADDDEDEEEEDVSGHRQYVKSRKHSKQEESWKRAGTAVKTAHNPLNEEEARDLAEFDKDDIGTHRFEKVPGVGGHRHKVKSKKDSVFDADLDKYKDVGGQGGGGDKGARAAGFGYQKDFDHTPHHLFIEMDELEGEMWVEKARWIKYEEDLEAGAGKWGKPHVSSLSFRSLLNVRKCLEKGVMMLDLQESDLPGINYRVVEQLSVEGIIEETMKPEILRVLNYRHKHVQPHQSNFRFPLKRNLSQKSLPDTAPGSLDNNSNGVKDDSNFVVEMGGMNGGQFKRNGSLAGSFKRSDSMQENLNERKQDILNCLEEGTEGCLTLVGNIPCDGPIAVFVRLANSIVMHNTIEVNLPMRFMFIMLSPEDNYNMDPHEVGRAFSTLMSNQAFHNVCYGIEEKRELLHAINVFLDTSVVLPPGDWSKQKLLAMADIMEMRKRREEREELKAAAMGETTGAEPPKKPSEEKEEEGEPPRRNPLERTNIPFGGLINDIKDRYPKYLSDIKDGFNPQCLAATIFIYFAALSGAVAFGGLMGAKTNNDIGISETLILTSICGAMFALFSGCPLIIIGTTGPVLLYDEALFGFCESSGIQFLSWRTWIGMWTAVIALLVAGFQGSTLVKHFTKFTKDIFASLVSLLFIYEALRKLYLVFQAHPLLDPVDYCEADDATATVSPLLETSTLANITSRVRRAAGDQKLANQPNTALLSAILMFGTFFIAYFLRIFRNSKYLGRNARRALGDFGVPIAIVLMVALDLLAKDSYTEKLTVPDGIEVTNSTKRGWFIPPTGLGDESLQVWAMFAALLPAILLYLLLFMETHICELIMLEKTKGEKGVGIHLDIVLLSLINTLSSFFGGPWICAATVRAVSHVSALIVMSTNVAPGESPKVVGVRDQRLSAFMVSVLLGLSVLMSPILKQVPFAVLFGVFLYMGVSGMNGVQFFDRLRLAVMPVKHHPQVSYVKRVKTWRMLMYTGLQGLGLVILWVVKSTAAALAFPFFVVAMIPFRYVLKFIFSEQELDALDGPNAGKNLSADDDEEDFFAAAAGCPIAPNTAVPLHRSVLAIMNMPVIVGGLPDGKESLGKVV